MDNDGLVKKEGMLKWRILQKVSNRMLKLDLEINREPINYQDQLFWVNKMKKNWIKIWRISEWKKDVNTVGIKSGWFMIYIIGVDLQPW